MTTEELMSLLEKQFTGWNRDGPRGIRTYLNIVHRILCTVEADQLMSFDDSTGKVPSFDTEAGKFDYNLPATVNFVDAILVESNVRTSLIDSIWSQDYDRVSRIHRQPSEYVNISGIRYVKIPYVRTYPWSESSVAKVVFTSDPGDTTDVYRYRGYDLPNDILSDGIALNIPPPYDMSILFPAVGEFLKAVGNNDYVGAFEIIEKKYKPEMHKAFNKGDFGITYEAEDHSF
jgi:hypothetical protein